MPDTPSPRSTGKRSHWLLAGIMAVGAALVNLPIREARVARAAATAA